ncbi:Hypothetical protein CAP_7433 [Chondromyces apiculatus DSM 436]|uniref:Uncharacterized protein n=1 Tax=Chondromyces apiculatus DSM 436 TaxID=1192034 RepID=A0A017SYT3_9BACT|nr:Hypothetical protein CAP_7433 [Chondromyces apiculatus DSM 436]
MREMREVREANLSRWRRRRRARGASVLVVVALLAALGALGMFAMSAAHSALSASGAARVGTQAQRLTDHALLATVAELSSPRGPAYVQQARAGGEAGCVGGDAGVACTSLGRGQLELLGGPLVVPPSDAGVGSLGWSAVGWDVRVELSDPMPALPSPPGFDETSAGAVAVRPVMVTLSATGVLWPGAPGVPAVAESAPSWAEALGATAVQAELRAHAVVRGVPR